MPSRSINLDELRIAVGHHGEREYAAAGDVEVNHTSVVCADRIASCEREGHSLFHASEADTNAVAVEFAVGEIPSSIRCKSAHGREGSRGAATARGHADKAKCIVALQLGVVHLGPGRRYENQAKKHGK